MINEVPQYPAVRPEIRSEIVSIEASLYELILKIQGSARELDQTAIVLKNYLDICESVRDKLLGLTDCELHTQQAVSDARAEAFVKKAISRHKVRSDHESDSS
jgi:hypothetical protein